MHGARSLVATAVGSSTVCVAPESSRAVGSGPSVPGAVPTERILAPSKTLASRFCSWASILAAVAITGGSAAARAAADKGSEEG